MTVKIIGLIRLKDPAAFEIYRSQVGATVEKYQGSVVARGTVGKTYWNELPCGEFTAFVELQFPSEAEADRWVVSAEYKALVPVRAHAIDLTLFRVEE
jgi:uncharacterized protein (DUF1330 family)